MRVKSASHVLSQDVSAALRFLGEEQLKSEYDTSAWLVEMFAKWFNIVSARNLTFALSKKNENKFIETINFLHEFVILSPR